MGDQKSETIYPRDISLKNKQTKQKQTKSNTQNNNNNNKTTAIK